MCEVVAERASGRGPDKSSRDTKSWGKSWPPTQVPHDTGTVLRRIMRNPFRDGFCKIHLALNYDLFLRIRCALKAPKKRKSKTLSVDIIAFMHTLGFAFGRSLLLQFGGAFKS